MIESTPIQESGSSAAQIHIAAGGFDWALNFFKDGTKSEMNRLIREGVEDTHSKYVRKLKSSIPIPWDFQTYEERSHSNPAVTAPATHAISDITLSVVYYDNNEEWKDYIRRKFRTTKSIAPKHPGKAPTECLVFKFYPGAGVFLNIDGSTGPHRDFLKSAGFDHSKLVDAKVEAVR